MEKHVPHYALTDVKAIVASRGLDAFTRLALEGLTNLGVSHAEGLTMILNLDRKMFYKSMTTHSDHRVWQDVYFANCSNFKTAYIKVTVQDGATVIQFKEK